MLKRISALLIIISVLSVFLCSCGGEPEVPAPTEPESYDLALIAERGKMNDGGYNELSMLGIERIAAVRSLTCKAYPSAEATDESRLAAIDLAVKGGAKVIVTPSYHFETAVYTAQTKYPDIKFIIIDGAPHPAEEYVARDGDIAQNTASICFSEEQIGYLAGYAAVAEGSRHLGFMGGMPIEAVRAYGNGFLQGAEAAAKDIGLDDGAVTVNYRYLGDIKSSDTNEKSAAAMYEGGADTIFACNSVVLKATCAAAEKVNGRVISAEFAKEDESGTVIACAAKELEMTVYRMINSVYNNTFSHYAGSIPRVGAEMGAVKLASAGSGFKSFTRKAYNGIYSSLATALTVPVRDFAVASTDYIATDAEINAQLALKKVKVIVEK